MDKKEYEALLSLKKLEFIQRVMTETSLDTLCSWLDMHEEAQPLWIATNPSSKISMPYLTNQYVMGLDEREPKYNNNDKEKESGKPMPRMSVRVPAIS